MSHMLFSMVYAIINEENQSALKIYLNNNQHHNNQNVFRTCLDTNFNYCSTTALNSSIWPIASFILCMSHACMDKMRHTIPHDSTHRNHSILKGRSRCKFLLLLLLLPLLLKIHLHSIYIRRSHYQ